MRDGTANEKNEDLTAKLGQSIAKWTDGVDRLETSVPGLALFKRFEPTAPMPGMYEPGVCLIAQGEKRILLGNDTYIR
jgi:hypothetical protein